MRRKLLFSTALVVAIVGCGAPRQRPASPATPSPKPTSAPTDRSFAAWMARESATLAPRRATSPDGFLSIGVDAGGPPTFDRDGEAYLVEIPIGDGEPVTCSIVPRPMDPAAHLRRAFAAIVAKLPKHETPAIEAGQTRGLAWLVAEAAYEVATADGPRLGFVKAGVARMEDGSVLCLHDEPGQRATFRRVLATLAEGAAFRTADPDAPPVWRSIDLVYVASRPTGWAETRVARAGDGWIVDSTLAIATLSGDGSIAAIDGAFSEASDSAGAIRKTVYATANDGAPKTTLTLEAIDAGRYRVSGTADGRAIDARFASRTPLLGTLGRAAAIAKTLVRDGAPSIAYGDWVPERRPDGLLDVKIRRGSGGAFEKSVDGDAGATIELDARGLETRVRQETTRGIAIEQRRAFETGTLPRMLN